MATVLVPAGSNIGTFSGANPAGTVFVLAAGSYANQQFQPQQGQQFLGDPGGGTILDGGNSTQYLASYAQNAAPLNILFQNITLQNYANTSPLGVVHNAPGWTFLNCIVRNNAWTGVSLGYGAQVLGGKYLNNGHAGIQGDECNGFVIFGAEIAGNNTNNDNIDVDAAGIKISQTSGGSITNCWIHDNLATGSWLDGACQLVTHQGNYVTGNSGSGILVETGVNCLVQGNNCRLNGTRRGADFDINISTSALCVIQNNIVYMASGSTGAGGLRDNIVDRADGSYEGINTFINNHATLTGTNSGFTNFSTVDAPTLSAAFDNNRYFVPSLAGAYFYWINNTPLTFPAYQAAGGDRHGGATAGVDLTIYVNATTLAGAQFLSVTSTGGFSVGRPVSIQLDTGPAFTTFVGTLTQTSGIGLGNPLPSQASAGNIVTPAPITLRGFAPPARRRR